MWFRKKRKPRRVILVELGKGQLLVGHTMHEGHPGIVICPAPCPGPIGEDASHLVPDKLAPDGSLAIIFTTPESIQLHRALLNTLGDSLNDLVSLGGPESTGKK